MWPSPEKGESILAEMIQQIKRDGRGKEYDCIIGLSGGVDSSFLATKVKEWDCVHWLFTLMWAGILSWR